MQMCTGKPRCLKSLQHIALLQWFDEWREHFYSIDDEMLLSLEISAQGITMKTSTNPHPNAAINLFDSQINGKYEVLRYEYGSLF